MSNSQAHIHFDQGALPGESGHSGSGSGVHNSENRDSALSTYTTEGGATSGRHPQAELSSLAGKLLAWMRERPASKEGNTVMEIAQGASVRGDGIKTQEVREAIDYLLDNGDIYVTIDNDHYLPA
ncbi:hypothetical protein DL93DRAFT_1097101 [Clavulina sp. PMI_390]|nr:hypothetical protein DL93DRAFT_1097101 [Clavulina sp. PMI_390]